MNMIRIAAILLLFPLQAAAEGIPIPLGDIYIQLEVTAQPRIEVEKPQGGWYSSIKLDNSEENQSLFQAKVPVTVKLRRQDGFKIAIKDQLILIHQNKPELTFSPAKVSWGKDQGNLSLLSNIPQVFTVNKGTASQTKNDYILHVSALAPTEKNTVGKYHGQLTLIFETNS
ncbi:fimbrial protein [Yersinia thracica]|uniref:fimbrial protein n=1 Tax=Yersinia thracica TaxID=2890319 RepID=UPI00119F5BD0|nr:fimbrial protein [Yersinia thracica]